MLLNLIILRDTSFCFHDYDSAGLYDPSVEPRVIAKEIAKCIDLAKDGIHAVLLVLSIRNRFSPEEASAFEGFREIFGPQIVTV